MMNSQKAQHWLILSHGFNMDGRAASLTVTDKIPYLIKAGIQPVVLSAVTGVRDQRFPHRQILPWGPAGFRFDLRHLLALRWGRDWRYRLVTGTVSLLLAPFILIERLLLGLQSQWSWTPAAVFWGLLALKRYQPRLIYSSGGAYSAHWAAYWLKKLSNRPWIAEIHDPMVFPGKPPENRNLKFWAKLEGMICANADQVWWFTEQAHASALKRHPVLGSKGFVVLPGANPPNFQATYIKTSILSMGHFGSLSSVRSLAPFICILGDFFAKNPHWKSFFQIHCYGSPVDELTLKTLQSLNLESILVNHGRLEKDLVTGQSGREQIQIRMHQMDVLLLFQGTTPDCSEYIPSKFYDYLWAKRPIFGLTHLNPQLFQLIQSHGGYAVEITETDQVLQKMTQIFTDWEQDTLPSNPLAPLDTQQAVQTILDHVHNL